MPHALVLTGILLLIFVTVLALVFVTMLLVAGFVGTVMLAVELGREWLAPKIEVPQ